MERGARETPPPGRPKPGALGMLAMLVVLAVLALGVTACGGAPPPEPPEPVVARAALDRSTATLGDRVTYTLTVDHATGVDVELPDPAAGLEDQTGLTVLEHGREAPRRVGDRVIETVWTRLRADQLGSYVLPPRTVRWRPAEVREDVGEAQPGTARDFESLETAALYLEVESVLDRADGEATDIRDLKPLEPPPPPFPWGLALAVATALVLALLALWWARRRREPSPEPPGPPPHERALAALAALEEHLRGALAADDFPALRKLYFQLSEVVRLYVEERFGLNATDLTSEEIVVALPGVAELEPEQAVELRRFLVATDPVKFASRRPAGDEVRDTLERARAFVHTTRRRPREDGEAPEGETTGAGATEIREARS